MSELLIKNALLSNFNVPQHIIIEGNLIKEITPDLPINFENQYDANFNIVCGGFFESHIHLDKACILERSTIEEGTLDEAVKETSKAKKDFSKEDVYKRASAVVEMAIKKGTMGLRTFVETDPKTELKSFEAIKQVKDKYAYAINIEICAFAQEGLTHCKETQELLREALRTGATVIGGCPYKDENPQEHIKMIFDIAQEFDVNVDFHLDFDLDPLNSSIPWVAQETIDRNYENRVSIGHVTKLTAMPKKQRLEMIKYIAQAQIALTVLPATDLFLGGRSYDRLVPRSLVNANELMDYNILTTISSNNILNAFTPYGDASLLRMANFYVNTIQLSKDEEVEKAYKMITENPSKLLAMSNEIAAGNPANLVVIEATNGIEAVRMNSQPLAGFKNGVQTFDNSAAVLLKDKC